MAQTVCPSCGAVAALPSGIELQSAKCETCKAALFPGAPLAVDDDALQAHISQTTGALLVAIGAPWCKSCQFMTADLVQAGAQLAPKIRLLLLNTNDSESARGYDLRGIPALLLFQAGKEIGRAIGLMSADQIILWVKAQLQNHSADSVREISELAS